MYCTVAFLYCNSEMGVRESVFPEEVGTIQLVRHCTRRNTNTRLVRRGRHKCGGGIQTVASLGVTPANTIGSRLVRWFKLQRFSLRAQVCLMSVQLYAHPRFVFFTKCMVRYFALCTSDGNKVRMRMKPETH